MKSRQALRQTTSRTSKRTTLYVLSVGLFLLALAFSAGCSNKFWDPTQIGRFRPTPAVNVILDSLGVAEEEPVAWENAEEPRPSDTIVMETDYALRAGDVVRVSIFELLQEGVEFVNDYVITESGKISIPEVGVLEAAGLTETQLEQEIRQILSPSILKEPSVVVTLLNSQQRTFSILGDGIPNPGRYMIPRYGFRLADALAMAGGPAQFNVSYIYVSRREKGPGLLPEQLEPQLDLKLIEPSTGAPAAEPEQPEQKMLEIIAPSARKVSNPAGHVVVSSSELASPNELVGFDLSSNQTSTSTASKSSAGSDEQVTVRDILRSLAQQPANPAATDTPTANVEINGFDSAGSNTSSAPAETQLSELEQMIQKLSGGTQATTMEQPAPTAPTRTPQPELPSVAEQTRPERVSIDDILKSLSLPDEQQPQPAPVEPPAQQQPAQPQLAQPVQPEQVDVEDILKGLTAPPPAQPEQQRQDLEELLRSFETPQQPQQPEQPVDVEELLKTVAPEQPLQGEQIQVESVETTEPSAQVEPEQAGHIEWIFKDGKWVPVQVGPPTTPEPVIKIEPEQVPVAPGQEVISPEFEWAQPAKTRLIRIPADKLLAGDPKYNIVVKPGDTIFVPVDVIGEFCIMGNVNRQGYIPLTGRPMTLKMAIAAAGGLGPLAWPKRVEVIRRIDRKKEEIVMVDLDKIASGEQPDFFIKPNDLINVGTHPTSRWRAVLRNAFRATYGFGFIYDRNFADRDFGNSPLPF